MIVVKSNYLSTCMYIIERLISKIIEYHANNEFEAFVEKQRSPCIWHLVSDRLPQLLCLESPLTSSCACDDYFCQINLWQDIHV